jgi:hypothetical protein
MLSKRCIGDGALRLTLYLLPLTTKIIEDKEMVKEFDMTINAQDKLMKNKGGN